MKEIELILEYIRQNETINEILFTGGDPMVMTPKIIDEYIDRIIEANIPHLKNIRFGSKSLTFWPFKYIPEHDPKADDLLKTFTKIVDAGYHLSFMAHFNHPNELNNEIVEQAIQNIRNTGAQIRTQAPILRNINDNSKTWTELWTRQVDLGLVPYYMFVERETGPFNYFQIPLHEVYKIYSDAIRMAGSLAKTVTGPVMSTKNGKVQILDIMTNPLNGEKYFVMDFIRHRDRKQTYKPFLTEFKENATWFDQVKIVETSDITV